MDLVPFEKKNLTRAQFEQLADVPPEDEWLANITNLKTRRAYKEDVREFIGFTGLNDYMGLRSVVRSHIISWRKDMERRGLAPSSIRRKLSALSSLFDYLCERTAVAGNPVDGVKRLSAPIMAIPETIPTTPKPYFRAGTAFIDSRSIA